MSTTKPEATPAEDAEPDSGRTAALANEYVASTLGQYARGQWQRIRSGDAGLLPVIIGAIVLAIVFQIQTSNFLTSGNLVNLFQQAPIYVVFAMSEIFILLLGEIDLSIGYNGGVAAALIAEYSAPPHNWNWFLAILLGVAVCTGVGLVQGLLVTRFEMPAFIVTLAGYIALQGLILFIFDSDPHATGGSIQIFNGVINGIIYNHLSATNSWIVMIVVVGLYALLSFGGNLRRRAKQLTAPPLAVTGLRVGVLAAAGVAIVLICNGNTGFNGRSPGLAGVPYGMLVVLVMLVLYTFILDRTKFGRYIYAIGGNPEAARRAGVRVKTIRTVCFVLAGFTAGIAGLLSDSFQGGASSAFNGGPAVLYAVAAAVIGGTSLFGGRGRMMAGLLGGLVMAGIANGVITLGLGTAPQNMITGLVLLAAIFVDSLARRGRTAR